MTTSELFMASLAGPARFWRARDDGKIEVLTQAGEALMWFDRPANLCASDSLSVLVEIGSAQREIWLEPFEKLFQD